MEYNENIPNEAVQPKAEDINQPVTDVVEQTVDGKEKNKKGRYLALKIIAPVLYGLMTLFLVITLIDVVLTANTDTFGLSLALWLTIFLIIIGSFGYIASMIPAIIGLILTLVRRPAGLRVGQLIYFIIFTVLPVITFFAFVLVVNLLN